MLPNIRCRPDRLVKLSTTGLAPILRRGLRMGGGRDVQLAAWLIGALAAGFLAYVARLTEVTHDVFHEMALVREALVQGVFPLRDVFAFTPTVDPSVHHEWATGGLLYFATVGSGLGVAGLPLLKLGLVAVLWWALYRVARLRGAHPYIFACLSAVVFPILWVGFSTLRAQLFTLTFIAVQLWMQELDSRGRRAWVAAWLILLVAWLNLHAGFVVGLGMMACHTVDRVWLGLCLQHELPLRRRLGAILGEGWHLIVAAPLAVMALRMNPYGWQYIPYLVRAIRMPRPTIREWQPLWHTYAPGLTLAMFAISVLLCVYALRHNPWKRFRGAGFLCLAAYMALKHIRHGSIFAVIWLAYVPAWFSRTDVGKRWVAFLQEHRAASIRVSSAIVAGGLLFSIWHQCWMPRLPSQVRYSAVCYPTGAVDYLRQQGFSGRLITPFHAGAYVSWELYPAVKVSLDGRYEVAYRPQVMPEHAKFFSGQDGWWELLERYPADAALIDRQTEVCQRIVDAARDPQGLAAATPLLDGWRLVYQDDAYVIIAAEGIPLQAVNRCGQRLGNGARAAFSAVHGHWNRAERSPLAVSDL